MRKARSRSKARARRVHADREQRRVPPRGHDEVSRRGEGCRRREDQRDPRPASVKGHVERRQVCEIEADAGHTDDGPDASCSARHDERGRRVRDRSRASPGALDSRRTARAATSARGTSRSRPTPARRVEVKAGGSIAGKVVDGTGQARRGGHRDGTAIGRRAHDDRQRHGVGRHPGA